MERPHGDLVRADLIGGVGVVTLARPERHNALNDAMVTELTRAMHWALSDDSARSVLLRAEGPSFSSGRDTAELGRRAGGESDAEFVRRAQSGRLATLSSPKPIVAAVQGYVLGGGFEMALSADMRMAADDARFGFPEIEFGLVTDTGGSQLLTMLAGPAKAKYLIISGERIDAATALAWGIVDWVVPRSELDDAALDLARRLSAAPPAAAAVAKQLVDQVWAGTVQRGITAELLAQTALFAGEEHRRMKAARLEELRKGNASR